jgi:putative tryptophan/tyrosine transport system substrate-binding protein
MRRRELLLLLGGAITAPRATRAQQTRPAIGWLQNASLASRSTARTTAFAHALSEFWYVEGQNITFEYRSAAGQYDRFPALAANLVSGKVDIILALGGPASIRAAQNATSTVPILFLVGLDPVSAGFVASLARPGGNITGVFNQVCDLTPKRLELLSELVPQSKTIALLMNPANGPELCAMQEAAQARGVELPILRASTEGEIDVAFASLASLRAGALIVLSDAFFQSRREQLVALAARYAVPTIFPNPEFAASGGLISYSPDYAVAFGILGSYSGKILKGARPADLPVQQPTKFTAVINLGTAKTLGLTVPQTILARADEVID